MAESLRDRYRLERLISSKGSFGEVWLATDTLLDRPVAIKCPKAAHDPHLRERFLAEARMLARLNHPNITQIYDVLFDEGEDRFYLVIEYVDGKDLAEIIGAGNPLPLDLILEITMGVLRALSYACDQGVVHRDVKPANVMIADEVKLTDFGLADLRSILQRGSSFMAGTPAYMAPEQIKGRAVGDRADLYAVGVMLFEMLAGGRLPFDCAEEDEMLEAHLHVAPPPISQFAPTVPPMLEQVILRLLAKNPQDRYPSAEAVMDVLGAVPVGPRLTNLPAALTPFVGREAELAEIQDHLGDPACRLLTLAGPGGIGKTRLALEAAAAQIDDYPHGVFFVRLAPLDSIDSIGPAVAEALGFRFCEEGEPQQQLLDYLRHKKMLLIMDSFEHLLEGVEVVADVLKTAPDVKILATSRARLNAGGEHLFPVAGMDLPALPKDGKGKPENVTQHSAVQLFLQSAHRVQPGFEPTADDLIDIAHICRLVQGIPLGILLATTWIEVLTPAEIAAEIGHSLDFLEADLLDVPARQRSIRAVFDHSWKLLTEREREVFQGLSVFRGGFTRQAAQQVTGASLRELMALIHKSLLYRTSRGRYEVHELLRGYAAEKLDGLPAPSEAVRDRHCSHFVAALQGWEADLEGSRRQAALAEMDAEIDNARTAWDWAVKRGQAQRLDQAIDGLCRFYRQRVRYQEGEAACRMAARKLYSKRLSPTASGDLPRVLVKILAWTGDFQRITAQYDQALKSYAQARAILLLPQLAESEENHKRLADLCRKTAEVYERRSEYDAAFEWLNKGLSYLDEDEPTVEEARIYNRGTLVYRRQGKYEEASAWCQKSLAAASGTKTREGQRALAYACYNLGEIYRRRGDLAQAVDYCRESVRLYQEIDYIAGLSDALLNLSNAYADQGDWDQAIEALRESLALKQEIGDIYGQAHVANNLGYIHLDRGVWVQAATLFEQAYAIWRQVGSAWGEANLLSNLAQVRIQQGDWDGARARLSRSQELFTEIGSEEFLPELERRWGEFYMKTGELDQALTHTQRSTELAVAQDVPWEEGLSYRILGQVHQARGEREAAAAALCRSLQILTDLNSEFEAAKTSLALVSLGLESDPAAVDRAQLAQAIQTFEKLGAKADLAEARALEGQLK